MPGTVTVVNKKFFRGRFEYIGRGSVFGNPYPVSMGRAECIAAYKVAFDEAMTRDSLIKRGVMALVERARKGEHLFLACYCAPLACHGDVIKAYIERCLKPVVFPSE